MRVMLATAILVGGALLSYAPWMSGVSAQNQSVQASITEGERIRFWFDPLKQSYNCTVVGVRGDFLGCKGAESGITPGPDRWYNLRLIALIERPMRQE